MGRAQPLPLARDGARLGGDDAQARSSLGSAPMHRWNSEEEQQERAHCTPHWSRGGLQPALSIHAESGDGQLSLLASREFSISK